MLGNLWILPVVDTIAIKGIGVHELVDAALELVANPSKTVDTLKYGAEVEQRIQKIMSSLNKTSAGTASKWLAIQLLEGKEPAFILQDEKLSAILPQAKKLAAELVALHGEDISTIISGSVMRWRLR